MSSIWTIRRSATDTKVAGVCGGIAQHWNIDPVLVRIGFAMLALSGGIGIVLYVAGWLLVPLEGKPYPLIRDLLGDQAGRWPREVWVAIVTVACIITFTALSSVSPFGFGPAVILAVIWYFGYYKNRARRAARPGAPQQPAPPPLVPQPPAEPAAFYTYPGPPTAFTQAADAWRQRIMEAQRIMAAQPAAAERLRPPTAYVRPETPDEDRTEPVGLASPPLGAPSPHAAYLSHPDPVGLYAPEVDPVVAGAASVRLSRADSLPARRLRLVGLVVLGLALCGLGIADWQGVHIPLSAYFAVALGVVALTLVAATWYGRARGLLPIGFLLLIAVLSTTVSGQVGSGTTQWGSRPVAYATLADLPPAGDSVDVGSLRVDLSKLVVSRDATYRAHVDLGRVLVTVPANTNVALTYSVDSGAVTVYGTQLKGGADVRGMLRPDPVRTGEPTLTLELSADVGSVEVRR